MNKTVRTFVAIETSPEVQTRAGDLIRVLAAAPAKVKWGEPAQLHFTLKFLGDIDLVDVPQICEAVKRAVAGLPPFEVEARGAGAFPNADRPRTIWLGTGRGAEPMVEVHAAVEQQLAPLGFRREQRRYRPHLTVGRVRGGPQGIAELGQLLALHADYKAGIVAVDEVVVFSSELTRTGPIYEPLSTIPLAGE